MSEDLLRILAVTGRGVEKIEATLAQVNLGIEARGEVAAEVQQEVASKSSAVVDLLRARNVEQLTTTGIRLNYYERMNQGVTKYAAINTVNFLVPIDDVGVLLDETVKVGASRVDGVNFTATEEAISGAKQQALRKATIDAKNKAEVVLNTLDFRLGEIVTIEVDEARVGELQSSIFHGQLGRASSRNMEESFEMPVVGGELTVNASVTLQISY